MLLSRGRQPCLCAAVAVAAVAAVSDCALLGEPTAVRNLRNLAAVH